MNVGFTDQRDLNIYKYRGLHLYNHGRQQHSSRLYTAEPGSTKSPSTMSPPLTTATSFTNLPSGIRIFHRTAGPKSAPNILLLHGYPSSSHQFRNLIPLLAAKGYRITAPDLPGFGFTEVPDSLNYQYTFANLASTIAEFLEVSNIRSYAVYIFDYGSPTGLRIAIREDSSVKAIISQNGNAYEEGLLPFWDPLRKFWAQEPGSDEENASRTQLEGAVLTPEATKWQYVDGEPRPELIDPASWTLDQALLERPGQKKIQLDLFKDYADNLKLYPRIQEYFRKSQVPLLAVWGKNDQIFGNAGAEAFKRDLPNAEVELWDGGHFLVESHTVEVAERIERFLGTVDFGS